MTTATARDTIQLAAPPADPEAPAEDAAPTEQRQHAAAREAVDSGGWPCAQTDPELFYPEPGSGGAKAAKAICQRCPVCADCLEVAIERDEQWGIWGGATRRERTRLARQRDQQRLSASA